MNIEKLFNKACRELGEDCKPNNFEALMILKVRANQFQGWVDRGESEIDIIENMRYIILSDLISIQVNLLRKAKIRVAKEWGKPNVI